MYVGNFLGGGHAALLGPCMYNPIGHGGLRARWALRGYGVVEFGTVDEAGMAIDGMNQTKFNEGL